MISNKNVRNFFQKLCGALQLKKVSQHCRTSKINHWFQMYSFSSKTNSCTVANTWNNIYPFSGFLLPTHLAKISSRGKNKPQQKMVILSSCFSKHGLPYAWISSVLNDLSSYYVFNVFKILAFILEDMKESSEYLLKIETFESTHIYWKSKHLRVLNF